MTDKIR